MRHERILEMSDIETALWQAAHWIWDRRATAKSAGFPFSEETITESVLLDIASSCPGQVRIVPFNKHQEGKIGADWEWCFYDLPTSRFLRFLMQAKVLDDKDHQYAHIDRYIGNSDVRQIDRLMETANQRNVTPLYAFYNHLSDEARLPAGVGSFFDCNECWGASVAPLTAVLSLLPDKTFEALKAVSFPWVCLVHPQCTAAGNPDRLLAVSEGLRVIEEQASIVLGVPGTSRREPENHPPDYFRALLDMPAELSPVVRDQRLRRISAANPGVDGVVLIDVNAKHPE